MDEVGPEGDDSGDEDDGGDGGADHERTPSTNLVGVDERSLAPTLSGVN
jgi:hypothetical protein